MWISSTATPARERRHRLGARRGEEAERGRSRLPPAARASPATRPRKPGRRLSPRRAAARARPCSARGRASRRRRAASRARSRVDRDDRAAEQAEADVGEADLAAAAPRAPRPAGSGAPTPAGTCRRRRPAAPSRATGTTRSNQRLKNGRSGPRGVVISRIASRPPGAARGGARAARRGRRGCGRRSRPWRVERPSSNGSAAGRPRPTRSPRLAARALEHRPRSRAVTRRARAQVGEREVAGAARASSTRSPAHGDAAASRRQRRSSPRSSRFIES